MRAEFRLQETQSTETSIGIGKLVLSFSGLILFIFGGYMSLSSTGNAAFLLPDQYFLGGGVLLSFIGIFSLLRRCDF